jgi:hypothetical protein
MRIETEEVRAVCADPHCDYKGHGACKRCDDPKPHVTVAVVKLMRAQQAENIEAAREIGKTYAAQIEMLSAGE